MESIQQIIEIGNDQNSNFLRKFVNIKSSDTESNKKQTPKVKSNMFSSSSFVLTLGHCQTASHVFKTPQPTNHKFNHFPPHTVSPCNDSLHSFI